MQPASEPQLPQAQQGQAHGGMTTTAAAPTRSTLSGINADTTRRTDLKS